MNREQVQKGNLASRPYEDRAVGCPPDPDLSAMTEDELEARRDTLTRLKELTEKAEKGDIEARTGLRHILQESPGLAWQYMDYGKLAEWHFIEKMTEEKNFASKESLARQLAGMRGEIVGEDPSPLERLLAERIVATWLQVQLFEGMYAAGMHRNISTKQGNDLQRLMDRAHRNHLSAIRTLAQIRKLGPAVQINIAEKQFNTTR